MDASELIRGVHDRHDAIGATALSDAFVDAVTAPVRLHIEAKRYLCAIDAGYLARLSAGSTFSLRVQGGAHTPQEASAFAETPFSSEAVCVRRWDDMAKQPGLKTPDLEHFRPYLSASLKG